MIKMLILGIWAVGLTAASSAGVAYWKVNQGKIAGTDQSFEGLEYKKTRSLNIPMIAEGEVQGYLIVQLVYTADSKTLKSLPVPPEFFLLDEAFQTIYSDRSIDLKHLERYDLKKFTKSLIEKMRVRLNADIIKEVLIEEFNYVARSEIRK